MDHTVSRLHTRPFTNLLVKVTFYTSSFFLELPIQRAVHQAIKSTVPFRSNLFYLVVW